MRGRLWVALLMMECGALAAAHAEPSPTGGTWNFTATLDGTPIGTHRYSVSAQGDELRVLSVARFDVKLLGITVYRYRHQASERWQGGCLAELDAHTDDGGTLSQVQARRDGDALALSAPGGARRLSGCVMTFAYWNPALPRQAQLLNAQTGRVEPVQFAATGRGAPIERSGSTVAARPLQITGPPAPIELWFGAQGEWIGLDSSVGGRRLSYRLEATSPEPSP